MEQYLNLVKYVSDYGVSKTDRTGTGTKSIFGYQMKFDFNNRPIISPIWKSDSKKEKLRKDT